MLCERHSFQGQTSNLDTSGVNGHPVSLAESADYSCPGRSLVPQVLLRCGPQISVTHGSGVCSCLTTSSIEQLCRTTGPQP